VNILRGEGFNRSSLVPIVEGRPAERPPREGDIVQHEGTFDGVRISRRRALQTVAFGAAAAAIGTRTRRASATGGGGGQPFNRRAEGVHPDLTQAGPEIALPPGFTYHTLGAFGSPMSDGFVTPPIHDGMGVFDQPGGGYRIVRNHEIGDSNDVGPGTVLGDPTTAYDRRAPGGCVTLVLDDDAKLVEHFISLNGTDSNCSGTPTPWGTWLTCEETTVGTRRGWGEPHGYVFEVDPAEDASVKRQPIRAMGRLTHEAAAVDPETSVVYLTEDFNPDGFYRYVPDTPGDLAKGGVLQALKVKEMTRYNTVRGQTVGAALTAVWVDIDDPDPDDAESHPRSVFIQARAKGAAKFMSGEGCTWREDHVVFTASDGGEIGRGQIWTYRATKRRGELDEVGELTLLYESTDPTVLDYPDNACTSPGGGIVLAEDGDDRQNYLRALLPDGVTMIPLAQNLVDVRRQLIDASGKLYDPDVPDDDFGVDDGVGRSEFAGPRFSQDGTWLFVNIQVPGITCAITGDWESLGL
jgi:secreted PhoX family phosphatase